jgi:uncharacterized SAM-binding protein YcdF (DUF218 family)
MAPTVLDNMRSSVETHEHGEEGAGMPILRIQHFVPTFDDWKRAFDSDPIDRKGGGVRRYAISRAVDDPNFVMIDLEFDTVEEAAEFHRKLRQLWDGPARAVTRDPRAWVVETLEAKQL